MAITTTIIARIEDILRREGFTVVPKDSPKEVDGYRVEYAESTNVYMIVHIKQGNLIPTGKLASLFQAHWYNTETDTVLKVWPE